MFKKLIGIFLSFFAALMNLMGALTVSDFSDETRKAGKRMNLFSFLLACYVVIQPSVSSVSTMFGRIEGVSSEDIEGILSVVVGYSLVMFLVGRYRDFRDESIKSHDSMRDEEMDQIQRYGFDNLSLYSKGIPNDEKYDVWSKEKKVKDRNDNAKSMYLFRYLILSSIFETGLPILFSLAILYSVKEQFVRLLAGICSYLF